MLENFLKTNYQKGQIAILATVFFVVISLTLALGLTTPIIKEVSAARDLLKSKESYFLAEASLEDVAYRLRSGKQYNSVETISLSGKYATTTVSDVLSTKVLASSGLSQRNIRKSKMTLQLSGGSAFFYGIQTGEGGFLMDNNSTVSGNVYSNGLIRGSGTSMGSATIKGDIVSAGTLGLIDSMHATGSAFAHTIENSLVDKNVYYQVLTNTTYGGTSNPGSPDQPIVSLPIDDSTIESYKSAALLGGTITSPCPYIIDSGVVLGPKKIDCDLQIEGDPTITLNGNLWVSGNIDIKNTATLQISPSLGAQSIAIVADNPLNRLTSSKIIIQNSTTFIGSGATSSYIMLVSQNNSSEQGGSEVAINIKNSATGKFLTYAGHGEILLENSASLKEITAYKIHLKNSANVTYESGLQSLLFSTGPSGGYEITSWEEI